MLRVSSPPLPTLFSWLTPENAYVVVPDRKQAKVQIFQFSFFFISKYTCPL